MTPWTDIVTILELVGMFSGGLMWGLSLRRKAEHAPRAGAGPSGGPYRTAAQVLDAPLPPTKDSLRDASQAIEDAVAKLNDDLRDGVIDAYGYTVEIDRLETAALKLAKLQKAMGGCER